MKKTVKKFTFYAIFLTTITFITLWVLPTKASATTINAQRAGLSTLAKSNNKQLQKIIDQSKIKIPLFMYPREPMNSPLVLSSCTPT